MSNKQCAEVRVLNKGFAFLRPLIMYKRPKWLVLSKILDQDASIPPLVRLLMKTLTETTHRNMHMFNLHQLDTTCTCNWW